MSAGRVEVLQGEMETIRCFIAIELPEEVRLELVHLQDSLKLGGASQVKWVDPHGVHLTLKFLGDVAADKTPEITKAVAEAAKDIPSFYLEVGPLHDLKLISC